MSDLLIDQVFRGLGIISATFAHDDMRMIGRDRGGSLHPTARGQPLWSGTFSLRTFGSRSGERSLIEAIEARYERLIQVDGSFLICPPSRIYTPQTTGVVSSIAASDRRRLQATNAAGLGEGDWLGVVFDGGRRGLHRVAYRNGSEVVLVTPLHRNVANGSALTFGLPTIRAIVNVEGYRAPEMSARLAKGTSVAWTQTLARPQ